MKTRRSLYTFLLLMAGVLVLLNLASESFHFRLDFTSDKRYTLSPATENILKSLDKPVTVKGYFSDNLPPDILKTKNDFREMLVEFSSRSGGNVVFEFINPSESPEIENQAAQAGVQPVMINTREKDQIKQQKAFLGAVITLEDRSDVIPLIQPGAAMEFALASAVKKVSLNEKPSLGFLQGHGEPSTEALTQAMNQLSVLYHVEPVNLNGGNPLPGNIKMLAIINPTDTFPGEHLEMIRQYLASGKPLLVAMNRVKGDFSTATGSEVRTGLEGLLSTMGIQVEAKFVTDAQCGSIQVRQQQGGFMLNTQMQFPYFPLLSKFPDHPIVKGLEQVMLRFPSPIQYTGDTAVNFVPFLMSGEKSGFEPAATVFNVQRQWSPGDFPAGPQSIGAAFSGKPGKAIAGKMVLIANGDFAVNGEGQSMMQVNPDNVSLLVNAIDWLADDTGLIELRTKGVTSRPLDPIEEGKKTFYKYLNFLFPIMMVLAFGFYRSTARRMQRIRRMEENFGNV